jgi:hypothetical protein
MRLPHHIATSLCLTFLGRFLAVFLSHWVRRTFILLPAILLGSLPVTTAAHAQTTQLDCAFVVYDPSLMMHSTTFESCHSEQFDVDLKGGGDVMWAQVSTSNAFAQVTLANVRKQLVQLPLDSGLAGSNLLVERDSDGMYSVSVVSPE